MSDTILAIDLGRHKSVACVYYRVTRGHTFRAIDTTPRDLDRLLARHPGALVVVEACANAGWVHDRAAAAGHVVKGANTAAEAWKFQHLKRKTDQDDALRLAELEAIGQLPTVALPDPATRPRRMLIAYRQELVGRRVACQNRVRALFAGQGLATPRGAAAWSTTGLAGIEGQAKPLAGCGRPSCGGGCCTWRWASTAGWWKASPRPRRRSTGWPTPTRPPGYWRRSRGLGRGRPRRWRRTWATHTGSRRVSRSGRTPGWCPSSTRAG